MAPPIPPTMPYIIGKISMAPKPIPKPIILAVGVSGPIMPVSEPATMENSATQIPTMNPSNAYTTPPTLNADPGPIRLKVATCASFDKWNEWDASRMNILPKDLNREPLLIRPMTTLCRFCVCYDFLLHRTVQNESEQRMTARILDGTKIRDQIFAELKDEVRLLTAAGVRPGLAAVLVGENPASQLYVKSKIAACEEIGLSSALITPPATVGTLEMLAVVEDLNRDNNVDGILIQLPLPPQVDTKRILEAVDPAKDVDGFHPVNLGRLVSGRPGLVACTPAGCMEILRRNNIQIEGANAVVLGRSDIVGKPMALLLMHANATVTICHSKTRDLPGVVRRADILIAAMGKAGYVEADWIKPGAAVIDVGTNRVTDPAEAERLFRNFPARLEKFRAKGTALVGDVHPDAINIAGALTPVPGGVGPMTIAMLMSNTVKAARLRRASPRFSATQSNARAR